MDTRIRDKIRKLLNLAGNNPNANEAARAMELASHLMMEHGIDQSSIEMENGKPKITETDMFDLDHKWHWYVAVACGHLYGCKPIGASLKMERFRFVGRPDNIDAAMDTFHFIKQQVESQYKAHLPKGLSKTERAEYRRSFKENCAMVVGTRAQTIANEQKAQSKALVVHRGALMEEIDAFLGDSIITKKGRDLPARALSLGMLQGAMAGEKIKLHKDVK